MTRMKFAAAAVLSIAMAPAAFAQDMDISEMTCEEYNQLGGADRDAVALTAIAALNDDVEPTAGTATETDDSVGDNATESEMAASEGSATATSIAGADDDLSRYAEEIAVLNRTCSRNWDAMVTEAAAGFAGTR